MSEFKGFFDLPENWEEEWEGMPEFVQGDQTPYKTLYVHFQDEEGMREFAKLVKQRVNFKTKFIWYPKVEPAELKKLRYADES